MSNETPPPQDLTVHQSSKVLEILFANGERHRIPFELMRVCSPSAEVQGHGPGQEVLQTGKREVGLVDLEPVGNYGIKPTFSDGHDSGIFSWTYLYFWPPSMINCGLTTSAVCKRRASIATPRCLLPRRVLAAITTE